jgi:flagellar biosynthetic protein FliQ
MNEVEALDILRLALWTVVVASTPSILAAMIVGVAIGMLQALTQIQEITLTFIPKIMTILIVLSVTAPFIGVTVYRFAEQIFGRIENGF